MDILLSENIKVGKSTKKLYGKGVLSPVEFTIHIIDFQYPIH